MMKKNTLVGMVMIVLLLSACNITETGLEKQAEVLIKKDTEFSDYSKQHGLKDAFIEYADSAAVLLKPNHMPIKGSLSIQNYYKHLDDSHLKLSWVPLEARIARSGDLGYTYGIWELSTPDTIENGTYVTVWKKNEKGKWKYVLDSGNEGLKIFREEDTD